MLCSVCDVHIVLGYGRNRSFKGESAYIVFYDFDDDNLRNCDIDGNYI